MFKTPYFIIAIMGHAVGLLVILLVYEAAHNPQKPRPFIDSHLVVIKASPINPTLPNNFANHLIKQTAVTTTSPTKPSVRKIVKPHPSLRTFGLQSSQERRALKKLRHQKAEEILYRLIQQQQFYPLEAYQAHQTGVVKLTLILDRRGKFSDVQLYQSSGFTLLDKAAFAIIDKIPTAREAAHLLSTESERFIVTLNFAI